MFVFYNLWRGERPNFAPFTKNNHVMNKKIMYSILLLIAAYFIGGGIVFNHLLKPSQPDIAAYFNKNRFFGSTVEGLSQEIEKVENGWVYGRLEMQAFAAGPPVHIHEHFDELFMVEKGTATMIVNGEKKTVKAGERLLIPRGTPHKPCNETAEVVILNDANNEIPSMPAEFAYGLAALYPAMDRIGDVKSPENLLQLAAQGNGFDTWASDVPIPLQKAIRWLLGPTARLLGYGKV
jgi:mannose-6-phosphate isomerase-like protein (cupin superfamily)